MVERSLSIGEEVLGQEIEEFPIGNGLTFHPKQFCLKDGDGKEIKLSAREGLVFCRLAKNFRRVTPREEVFQGTGIKHQETFISRLRRKVEPNANRNFQFLVSRYGQGIMLTNPYNN